MPNLFCTRVPRISDFSRGQAQGPPLLDCFDVSMAQICVSHLTLKLHPNPWSPLVCSSGLIPSYAYVHWRREREIYIIYTYAITPSYPPWLMISLLVTAPDFGDPRWAVGCDPSPRRMPSRAEFTELEPQRSVEFRLLKFWHVFLLPPLQNYMVVWLCLIMLLFFGLFGCFLDLQFPTSSLNPRDAFLTKFCPCLRWWKLRGVDVDSKIFSTRVLKHFRCLAIFTKTWDDEFAPSGSRNKPLLFKHACSASTICP
jgi:hypothetical protein